MRPRHIAIVSGLTLSIALGTASLAIPAFADSDAAAQSDAGATDDATASVTDADDAALAADADAAATGDDAGSDASTDSDADAESGERLPEPADYDKADFYEEPVTTMALRTASAARSSSLSPVYVSDEMKYFTEYESHGNYRQGFSYGDGYNALGYYQFDRRYSLIGFITSVYNYNPSKYSMFKAVIDRGSEVANASSMYDEKTGQLTELGQLVQDAWYAAYDADPAEFSAFQDAYSYNSYYAPTESWLASQGIDISGRADCVKGMVWGLSNLWGAGGVRSLLRGANLSNDMTDREFVTALSEQMTKYISRYSSQTEYYAGWRDRYESELNDCLAYIAEDEAAGSPDDTPADDATSGSAGDAGDQQDGSQQGDAGSTDDGGAASDADSDDGSGTGDSGSDDAGSGDAGSGDADGSDDDAQDGGTAAGSGSASGDVPASDGGSDANGSDGASGSDDGGSNDADDSNGSGSDDSASQDGSTPDDGGADDDAGNKDDGSSTATGGANGTSDTQVTDPDGEDAGSDDGTDLDDGTDEAKDDEDGKSDGSSDKTDGQDDTDEKPKATDDDGSDDGSDPDAPVDKPTDSMPQMSDLTVITGLASASAATFGLTFIAAGRRGLKRKR